MNVNVGEQDSYVRLAVGALLVLVGAAGYLGMVPVAVGPLPQALTSVVLALVGIVLLVTGYTRKCMIYDVLGKDTSE